jgi:hypothetical protein
MCVRACAASPSVTSVTPTRGPVVGGTLVTVAGADLDAGDPAARFCVFGDAWRVATLAGTTALLCTAPAVSSAQTVAVAVSTDGQIVSATSQPYDFFGTCVRACVDSAHAAADGRARARALQLCRRPRR